MWRTSTKYGEARDAISVDGRDTLPGTVQGRAKARAKGKMEEKRKPRAKTRRATERKMAASSAVTKTGSPQAESTKDIVRHVVKLDTRRRNVDGESLASTRKKQTAQEVEVNMNKSKTEESEVCGSLDMLRNARSKKARPPGVPIQVQGT